MRSQIKIPITFFGVPGMQGMKQISMIVASVALALSGQVFAETSPEAGNIKGDAAKAKDIAAQVCAACHGADGNSPIPANPSLAGQHAEYLANQLRLFRAGKRGGRLAEVMSATARGLTDEDIEAVAMYYSALR